MIKLSEQLPNENIKVAGKEDRRKENDENAFARITKDDIDVPNWQKVTSFVKHSDGNYSLTVYDKTEDEDQDFELNDGILSIEGPSSFYEWPNKIENKEELENAIEDWSNEIRGYGSDWKNDDDD